MKEFILHRDLNIDPLTGLYNFMKFINEDLVSVMGQSGVILIFDIAQFKAFNNTYGRLSGDKVIICIASILKSIFGSEIIYRTEGDGFTVILKDADLETSSLHLEQVQKKFREQMLEYGFKDIKLHQIVYPYEKEIKSIEEYYMFIVKEEGKRDLTNKFTRDGLIEHIITGIVSRFKQSLKYYNEVYNYALIDEISGLPNSKAARQKLSSMFMEDTKKHYAILFIDGDDLKKYNDISYQTGNDMIRKMGYIIQQSIRNKDKIFRWLSGDEFLVILEDVDETIGFNLAERIRQAMVNSRNDFIYPTTISIGVSYFPDDGIDFDEVVRKAEKANKQAKASGKNKVVCWKNVTC